MRENSGQTRRGSNKFKAALVALLAVFAVGMFTAANANAAQHVKLSFNDSWIGVDALGETGTFHAVDPADENPITVDLEGDLASDGSFTAPKSSFSFPDQNIDAGEGFGVISLKIKAIQDITGHYNTDTGAFDATLPLALQVIVPDIAACQLSPLNIPLATTGSHNFGTEANPDVKSGAPFASGTGSALGSWTDVTTDNVKDIDETTGDELDPQTGACAGLIGIIMTAQGIDSFDGSIWLGGSATVTGEKDPVGCPDGKVGTPPNCVNANCPEGQEGTPPNCHTIVVTKPANPVISIAKKATVKAGGKVKIKVTVKNTGGAAFSGKVAVSSSNKQVKATPKSIAVKVAAGKSVTKVITVKATKKAKGKATITAKVGKKSAKAKVTVKAAKKKRK